MPLVVLAGLAAVGGAINLPFNDTTEKLSTGSSPSSKRGERQLSSSTEDIKWVLAGIATLGAAIGIGARLHGVRQAQGEGRRTGDPRQRLVLRPGRSRVHGRPRPCRASRASRGSTPTSSTVPSNGTGRCVQGVGRHHPQGAERIRPHLRSVDRHRRRPAACVVLPTAGCRNERPVSPSASTVGQPGGFPILTMLILVPAVGSLLVALLTKRRPEFVKLVAILSQRVHRRARRLDAGVVPHGRGGLPVRPASTSGSRRGASAGTSASTASRCSSSCSPACCSRSRSSAPIRITTRSRTWPGCCCSKPA